jgi:hypothetical protein
VDVLKSLNGKKTYLGAAALAGLAMYQFYTAQYQAGFQSLVAAWTAMGLRSAIGQVQKA